MKTTTKSKKTFVVEMYQRGHGWSDLCEFHTEDEALEQILSYEGDDSGDDEVNEYRITKTPLVKRAGSCNLRD